MTDMAELVQAGTWAYRHNMARLFYLVNREQILALWQKAEQGEGMRPRSWTRFVENSELWQMAQERLACQSEIFRAAFTYTEIQGDAEALHYQEEEYFLMPLGSHTMVSVEKFAGEIHTLQNWTVRQFVKTTTAYAFADITQSLVTLQLRVRSQPLEIGPETINEKVPE